jgi:hypothetical protein
MGDTPATASYQSACASRMSLNSTATTHIPNVRFPAVMRANPTVTIYSPENGAVDRVADWGQGAASYVADRVVDFLQFAGTQGFSKISLGVAGGPVIVFHYTADAEL